MDYNLVKSDVQLLKTLLTNIQSPHCKIDSVLLHQKIDDLQKYLSDTDNVDVYKELIKLDFPKTLIGIFRIVFDRLDLKLTVSVSKFISSITEYSEEFGEALVKVDIPSVLISVAIKCGDKAFLSQVKNSSVIDDIIYYVLHITYHIIRHIRFHQCFLTNKDINQFKETIQPWMSSKVINTRILATFVITWLMKEDGDDKNMIEKHSDVIKHVCEYINVVIKAKEKYYRGYSLWELLFGLQALTSIDSIKSEIINVKGFLSSLITIINADFSEPREIETSLEILWSLTFVEKNRDVLKKNYKIEEVVKRLSKSDNLLIRKKVKGILWELNKKTKTDAEEKDVQYDVFLSYSHAQKEPIGKLAAVLKTKFKVWIDIDNMKGSGLNDMAIGIEQSKIFMMAVSNSYRQSQCCRSEASWAYKLNKPIIPLIMVHKYSPDGWLGMMISSETYIDFSEQCDFEDASDKIIKHITYKCGQLKLETVKELVLTEKKPEQKSDLVGNVKGKSIDLPENTRDWTSEDVTQWLTEHKLSHLKAKFAEFDGGMLLAMKNMMEKTYEKYNDNMEKKFQMTLTDILKFDSALSSLNI